MNIVENGWKLREEIRQGLVRNWNDYSQTHLASDNNKELVEQIANFVESKQLEFYIKGMTDSANICIKSEYKCYTWGDCAKVILAERDKIYESYIVK